MNHHPKHKTLLSAPVRSVRLLSGGLFAATFALGTTVFGHNALAAAGPYDPFGNEDCLDAGGHPLDCCLGNNGVWIDAGGPAPGSSAMGACAPPGLPKVPGAGPGNAGGAGPAGVQSTPPNVVPRPRATPPQEVATPAPVTSTLTPASPG